MSTHLHSSWGMSHFTLPYLLHWYWFILLVNKLPKIKNNALAGSQTPTIESQLLHSTTRVRSVVLLVFSCNVQCFVAGKVTIGLGLRWPNGHLSQTSKEGNEHSCKKYGSLFIKRSSPALVNY